MNVNHNKYINMKTVEIKKVSFWDEKTDTILENDFTSLQVPLLISVYSEDTNIDNDTDVLEEICTQLSELFGQEFVECVECVECKN
jgi:hypothetical protein